MVIILEDSGKSEPYDITIYIINTVKAVLTEKDLS